MFAKQGFLRCKIPLVSIFNVLNLCVFVCLVAIRNVPDYGEGSNMFNSRRHHGNKLGMQSIKNLTVSRHLLCHQPSPHFLHNVLLASDWEK